MRSISQLLESLTLSTLTESDKAIRELERSMAAGDPEARRRFIARQIRSGSVGRSHKRLVSASKTYIRILKRFETNWNKFQKKSVTGKPISFATAIAAIEETQLGLADPQAVANLVYSINHTMHLLYRSKRDWKDVASSAWLDLRDEASSYLGALGVFNGQVEETRYKVYDAAHTILREAVAVANSLNPDEWPDEAPEWDDLDDEDHSDAADDRWRLLFRQDTANRLSALADSIRDRSVTPRQLKQLAPFHHGISGLLVALSSAEFEQMKSRGRKSKSYALKLEKRLRQLVEMWRPVMPMLMGAIAAGR